MLAFAIRNLWEHKLRTFLLGLAVVAGVGFVTASYVFTDSLSAAFDEAFAASNEGVDILVVPGDDPSGGTEAFPRIDAALVDVVEEVEGVAAATPLIQGFVTLVVEDEEDQPFGAPDFGISWTDEGPFSIESGVAPSGGGQALIDVASAERRGIGVGDSVEIAGVSRAESFEVVGTFALGAGGAGFGATFLAFDYETAVALLDPGDEVNEIQVRVAPESEADQVLDAINAVLPDSAEALDSRTAAAEQAAELQEGIGFFNTFLLVFGAIALLVGSFVIYNAFRVVVAQRSRELALLRILGSTRRQLALSVLVEALVVGAVASLLGIAAGLGLAIGIRVVLAATGGELPDTGLVLALRTVAVGLGAGMVTTVLSALIPALRTVGISPMEALRDQRELRRVRPWWAWVGGLLLVCSAVLVGVGAALAYDEAAITGNTDPLALIGVGCLIAFASFFLLARSLVRPVLGLIGRGANSSAAQLGRENARRAPRRTAVTATALMIGLGLVATVAVLSSSVEETILGSLDEAFTADLFVQSGGFDPLAGFGTDVAEVVAAVDGVDEVARLNSIQVDLPDDQGTSLAVGVEPETVELAVAFDSVEGTFADLGPSTVAVQQIEAENRGIELGDEIGLTIDGEPYPAEVIAIFDFSGGVSDSSSYYLHYAEVQRLQDPPRDTSLAISVEPGLEVDAVAEDLSQALSDYPGVEVSTIGDLADLIRSGLTAVVGMVAGLLLMSVAVAVVGIVLTLYLAVFERTRETGLLRAVGMTRRQVRRMIRFESILIAVFGTLLGVALGLYCGWALSVAVVGEGVRFGVPWIWILSGLAGALLAGVLAAVIPARRAARMDVLAAIAYE